MTSDEALLLEQVVSAFRSRSPQGAVRPCPAWFDLDEGGRQAAFEATVLSRGLEAAMDPDGQSTTVKAVLARIRREPPGP
jgi:hypothetical protein